METITSIHNRLKESIRKLTSSSCGCQMLSKGDACTCPLCDADNLFSVAIAMLAALEKVASDYRRRTLGCQNQLFAAIDLAHGRIPKAHYTEPPFGISSVPEEWSKGQPPQGWQKGVSSGNSTATLTLTPEEARVLAMVLDRLRAGGSGQQPAGW